MSRVRQMLVLDSGSPVPHFRIIPLATALPANDGTELPSVGAVPLEGRSIIPKLWLSVFLSFVSASKTSTCRFSRSASSTRAGGP